MFKKERIRDNANKEDMKLCYRSEGRFCSKKREYISIIKNRKREGSEVCKRLAEKRIYLTIEVIYHMPSPPI